MQYATVVADVKKPTPLQQRHTHTQSRERGQKERRASLLSLQLQDLKEADKDHRGYGYHADGWEDAHPARVGLVHHGVRAFHYSACVSAPVLLEESGTAAADHRYCVHGPYLCLDLLLWISGNQGQRSPFHCSGIHQRVLRSPCEYSYCFFWSVCLSFLSFLLFFLA